MYLHLDFAVIIYSVALMCTRCSCGHYNEKGREEKKVKRKNKAEKGKAGDNRD